MSGMIIIERKMPVFTHYESVDEVWSEDGLACSVKPNIFTSIQDSKVINVEHND